jgi:hypothetical protein
MRRPTVLITLFALAGCAMAARQSPPDAKAPADPPAPAKTQEQGGVLSPRSTVDEILDALDARGRNLKAFAADVSLTEGDATLATEVTRTGRAVFQDQGEGRARLRVTFDERDNGKRVFAEKIEYLLEGGWLTDRDYKRKIEVRRQVLRPGQKLDLLKLGEGPFPLPIGQKKEAVHEQFGVEKIAPAKDDPAGTLRVRLTPKPGGQFARKFDEIDVWVDAKTHMPARIDTVQGETVRTTVLRNFTANPEPPLGDKDFALPSIERGEWDLHEEPFKE